MYCAWRIPAHLRCTQCSILVHLMDICFLTCICLWQISQIQTFLFRVVGPGLVSTSPAFVGNSASHPAGPHGRHAQKNGKSGPHCWGRGGSTQIAQQLEFAVTAPPLVGCVVWSQWIDIIIIIVYHIRRRRLLCAQNFVQTSLFAKFISSNADFPTILLRKVIKVSCCRPLSRLPIYKSSYDEVFPSPFRRICPRKVSCL